MILCDGYITYYIISFRIFPIAIQKDMWISLYKAQLLFFIILDIAYSAFNMCKHIL